MYNYRKLTPQQRAEVLAGRKARGYPWHVLPHVWAEKTYMLSGACFEHKHVLVASERLTEFSEALVRGFEKDLQGVVHAWAVLPNHWHVLGHVDLPAFRKWIARLHNGKST
jgi:putative transposase